MTEMGDRPDDSQTQAAGVDATVIDAMLRVTVGRSLEQNDRMAALAAFVAQEATYAGLL